MGATCAKLARTSSVWRGVMSMRARVERTPASRAAVSAPFRRLAARVSFVRCRQRLLHEADRAALEAGLGQVGGAHLAATVELGVAEGGHPGAAHLARRHLG